MDLDAFKRLFATVRELGTSGTRQRGFVAFRGEGIQYDSSYEYAFLKRAATDPATIAITSQPCRIVWRDEAGRLRRYVPDYAVLYEDGPERWSACVVEVKPLRFALSFPSDERIKYAAASAWSAEAGVGFAFAAYCSARDKLDTLDCTCVRKQRLHQGLHWVQCADSFQRRNFSRSQSGAFSPQSYGNRISLQKRLATTKTCAYVPEREGRSQSLELKEPTYIPPLKELLHHAMKWTENCIANSGNSSHLGE